MIGELPQAIDWSKLSQGEKKESLLRPKLSENRHQKEAVAEILKRVQSEGDSALAAFTAKFDQFDCGHDYGLLEVYSQEWKRGLEQTSLEIYKALEISIQNISSFHELQKPKNYSLMTAPGILCEKRYSPLERVGFYIPGGSAPLLSTVLMLGIPAQIAGCEVKVMATPPGPSGDLHPALLAAAKMVGVQRIFKVGGAQAIAALAYGTEKIPKVDKIFGPGNSWVTEAKVQVSMDAFGAAIDLPAGPSEVLVIADEKAKPSFVAADLLAQAEHGPDSQVILISESTSMLTAVQSEVLKQVKTLTRSEICQQSLQYSRWILASDLNEALMISEQYAPEHLILHTRNADDLANKVRTAGSVFVGDWTPEALGDYSSGTNHVLPTYGFARAHSGVSVDSFMRATSFQKSTQEGLAKLGPVVGLLADVEGLSAHAQSVRIRLQDAVK